MAENETYTLSETAAAANTDEKTFTQAELELLLSERLKRERKNNASLAGIKVFLKDLKEKGLLKSGSYSEMASELAGRFCAAPDPYRYPEEPDEPDVSDAPERGTPTSAAEDALAADAAAPSLHVPHTPGEQTKPAENQNDGAEPSEKTETRETERNVSSEQAGTPIHPSFLFSRMTVDELCALAAAFPDSHVVEDVTSAPFRAFCEGRSGDASDVYAAYLRLKSQLAGTNTAAAEKNRGSTSFTGGTAQKDYSLSLTKRQMDIARDSGMSYKEYAELLESLPRSSRAERLC